MTQELENKLGLKDLKSTVYELEDCLFGIIKSKELAIYISRYNDTVLVSIYKGDELINPCIEADTMDEALCLTKIRIRGLSESYL